MSFIFRRSKMVLLLLLVAAYSYGQVRDTKNFITTPQTVVKINLSKLDSCLFKLQEILRKRSGQSVIIGGRWASGSSVIELWTDFELEGKEHYILNISTKKLFVRGATQKAIQYGLKTLDKTLQEETNNMVNKQIAPRCIENVPDGNCP